MQGALARLPHHIPEGRAATFVEKGRICDTITFMPSNFLIIFAEKHILLAGGAVSNVWPIRDGKMRPLISGIGTAESGYSG